MARPPMQPEPGISFFADRLNRLFKEIHSEDRGPYVPREVHEALAAEGVSLSVSMIAAIRKGERRPPGVPVVTALARFFGVPLSYFDENAASDPAAAVFGEKMRMLIAQLHEPGQVPDTCARISQELRKMGSEIRVNRLAALKAGLDVPDPRELEAIADYFGVQGDFFAPDADSAAQRDALSVLGIQRQLKIRQIIACASRLGEDQLAVAVDILRSLGSLPAPGTGAGDDGSAPGAM